MIYIYIYSPSYAYSGISGLYVVRNLPVEDSIHRSTITSLPSFCPPLVAFCCIFLPFRANRAMRASMFDSAQPKSREGSRFRVVPEAFDARRPPRHAHESTTVTYDYLAAGVPLIATITMYFTFLLLCIPAPLVSFLTDLITIHV